jgi:CheY-like chemotaxis protein
MGKKLLLADNSATIQKLVEMALADTDYKLEMVGDGEQALKVLESFRPDIVLAASIMPMMDGYRLCEEIKKHPDFVNIPVILSTSRFRPYDQERADQVGVSARLVKPFSQELLLEALDQMLQASEALVEDVEDDLLPEVVGDILDTDDGEGDVLAEVEVEAVEEEAGDLATVAMTPDELKDEMEPLDEADLPGPDEDLLLEDDEPGFDDVQFDDDEAEVASQVSEAFAEPVGEPFGDTEPLDMESATPVDEAQDGNTMELHTTDLEDLESLDDDELEDLDDDAIEDFDTQLDDDDEVDLTPEPNVDLEPDDPDATVTEELDDVRFDMAEEEPEPLADEEAFDLDGPDSLDAVSMDDDDALDLDNVSFDTGETDSVDPEIDTEPMAGDLAEVTDELSTLPQEPLDADEDLLDMVAADDEETVEAGDEVQPEALDAESLLDVETETAEFEEFDQPLLENEAEEVVPGLEEDTPFQADNDAFDPAAEFDEANDIDLTADVSGDEGLAEDEDDDVLSVDDVEEDPEPVAFDEAEPEVAAEEPDAFEMAEETEPVEVEDSLDVAEDAEPVELAEAEESLEMMEDDELEVAEDAEPVELADADEIIEPNGPEAETLLEDVPDVEMVQPEAEEMPAAPTAPLADVAGAVAQVVPAEGEAANLSPEQMDELAERVAEKVITRLTSDTIRDIAWEVVPELAEAMIKRRIFELERSAEDA